MGCITVISELDECAQGSHRCDRNADCKNTAGSYKCYCKEGYKGDGYSCERRSLFS